MKLHTKLCIIFSAIVLATQLVNALAYYAYERERFEETAIANLAAMGEKIIQQYEEYVQVMDYTLESLLANVELMEAMATLTRKEAISDPVTMIESHGVITRVLYREPLNRNYYRVNIFTRRGDFFTSRFDNRDTVNSMTFEMDKIVEGIQWLDLADRSYFERTLIPPYRDPWTYTREEMVFGAGRSVLWLGVPIGYLEVQARVDELKTIFSTGTLTGVHVRSEVSDGTLLYESRRNTSTDWIPLSSPGSVWAINPDSGVEEFVMRLDSADLTLILSQDASELRAAMRLFVQSEIIIGLGILAVSVLIVTLISMRLTRSIRRLEKRIGDVSLSGEKLMLCENGAVQSGGEQTSHNASGDEIAHLETAFDALVARLDASMQDVLAAQQLRLQAHFHALQAQIHPHFMYNTLNMIASKSIETGSVTVAEICERFADMLRYTTDMQSPTASIAEELTHARNYLELLKARYEARLDFTIDVPQSLYTSRLPRVSLQPIVENCVLHGYRKSTDPMKISIMGLQETGGFSIIIRDNGDGFPEDVLESIEMELSRMRNGEHISFDTNEQARGIGLVNTLSRMYFIYGKGMEVTLMNEHGAVVALRFPTETPEEG